ncbi:BamA/TamA family outer membrane protein [bacterium SCSIO 12741]|nr:BamA/TamA family outer membrane protein [bacterium SCSIO 12741]
MNHWYTLLIVVAFVVGFILPAQTQEDTFPKSEKKAARKAKKEQKLAEGRFMITPVAAPGYTPELGGLIAIGGLPTFKTNRKDTLIQRSSFPMTIGYTTTGAIVANGILTSFWLKDRLRINGDFWYKDMPDHYWGVGYDAGREVPKSDSTTAFQRQWWWVNPRFLFQVRKHYFVGLNVDLNYTEGSDPSLGVRSDLTYIKYNRRPLNTGLGLILRYDSRDVPVDARKGLYLDFRGTIYSDALGGDNDYQVYLLDYRQFQTIHREGRTLAWQAKLRLAYGDVPYGEMSQLGTPFDLRGYQWGRYRNDHLFYFLAEYRHTFYGADQELTKHSAVAWLGSGTVFDGDELDNNNLKWLPNLGVGYRFEVQPRMNIRLDYGIGIESSGIYFNFNQAF